MANHMQQGLLLPVSPGWYLLGELIRWFALQQPMPEVNAMRPASCMQRHCAPASSGIALVAKRSLSSDPPSPAARNVYLGNFIQAPTAKALDPGLMCC